MKTLRERILPVIFGVIVGGFVIFLLELANHAFYPPPTDLDFYDRQKVMEFMEALPTASFVLLLVAWMIGAFAGGSAAALLNRKSWKNNGIIVGVILALTSVVNMVMIPHPAWLMITTCIGYVPFAYLGASLFKHR